MREFDPENPMARRKMREMNNDGRRGLGAVGILAGLAIALVGGFFIYNADERSDTTANTSVDVTTGLSKTSPPSQPSTDNSKTTR